MKLWIVEYGDRQVYLVEAETPQQAAEISTGHTIVEKDDRLQFLNWTNIRDGKEEWLSVEVTPLETEGRDRVLGKVVVDGYEYEYVYFEPTEGEEQ